MHNEKKTLLHLNKNILNNLTDNAQKQNNFVQHVFLLEMVVVDYKIKYLN